MIRTTALGVVMTLGGVSAHDWFPADDRERCQSQKTATEQLASASHLDSSVARVVCDRGQIRVARIRGLCNKCVDHCVFWQSRVDPHSPRSPQGANHEAPNRATITTMTRARRLELVAVVLAALCVGCFLLSIPYAFGLGLGHNSLGCASGCLVLDRRPTSLNHGVIFDYKYFDRNTNEVVWTPTFKRHAFWGWMVSVPLWAPFVLFVVVAVRAHRRARGPKPGTCPKCRYDLTGNTSGACPECGTLFATAVTDSKPTAP